jgi:hypothetical protein
VWRRLVDDAKRAATTEAGPGGHPGTTPRPA